MTDNGDPIGAAIAAADSDPFDRAMASTPNLVELHVLIASSQRPAVLLVPDNLNDVETIELATYVLIQMRPNARRESPALVVARQIPKMKT